MKSFGFFLDKTFWVGVRPALYLNSDVLLTGGTGADAATAYTIG